MDASTLAWSLFALGMFLVWTAVYLKTGSFRKSMLASLLVGKSFAIAYKLGGLDRMVYTLYRARPRATLCTGDSRIVRDDEPPTA